MLMDVVLVAAVSRLSCQWMCCRRAVVLVAAVSRLSCRGMSRLCLVCRGPGFWGLWCWGFCEGKVYGKSKMGGVFRRNERIL